MNLTGTMDINSGNLNFEGSRKFTYGGYAWTICICNSRKKGLVVRLGHKKRRKVYKSALSDDVMFGQKQ